MSSAPQNADPNELSVPLFGVLRVIGLFIYKNPHHFNTGTLFWSLARLFGCYERIMEALSLPFGERHFLEDDIENFIIRFRIVLNDIAYVVWQIMPPHVRGLSGPSGGTHPNNREVSIFTLTKFFDKNKTDYPEIATTFAQARQWMDRLRNDRDNVIHYKSKVLAIDSDPPSFALISAAGTERSVCTPNGEFRIVTEDIADFVNGQLLSLHNFMHYELARVLCVYVSTVESEPIPFGWSERMSCIGTRRFKELNGI